MPQRITLVCVGRLKSTALLSVVRDLEKKLDRYTQYCAVETKDVKRSKNHIDHRPEEAKRLMANVPKGSYVVALDERSAAKSTEKLVKWYDGLERRFVNHLTFIIGGPDGLDPSVISAANETLSLSPMTFTHELARLLLTEQLYRVLSHRSGHPYHRV